MMTIQIETNEKRNEREKIWTVERNAMESGRERNPDDKRSERQKWKWKSAFFLANEFYFIVSLLFSLQRFRIPCARESGLLQVVSIVGPLAIPLNFAQKYFYWRERSAPWSHRYEFLSVTRWSGRWLHIIVIPFSFRWKKIVRIRKQFEKRNSGNAGDNRGKSICTRAHDEALDLLARRTSTRF